MAQVTYPELATFSVNAKKDAALARRRAQVNADRQAKGKPIYNTNGEYLSSVLMDEINGAAQDAQDPLKLGAIIVPALVSASPAVQAEVASVLNIDLSFLTAQ